MGRIRKNYDYWIDKVLSMPTGTREFLVCDKPTGLLKALDKALKEYGLRDVYFITPGILPEEGKGLYVTKGKILNNIIEKGKVIEEMIYLGLPYSHPEKVVREMRFKIANKVAGALIAKGKIVYSPISQSHVIRNECDLSWEWEDWEKLDLFFLNLASKLIVLKLEGWEDSVGLQAEIKFAKERGIVIEYIEKENI